MIEGFADELHRMVEEGRFRIPPIPEVALRVTELASNPEVSAAAIVEIVQRDPSLSSELLRYANSAAIGSRVEIVSVRQATVHLGIPRVSQVALATSLRGGVFDAPAYAGLAKDRWSRSVATALVAKRIARRLAQNVEVAFLCGLLWQVGSMLALQSIGEINRAGKLLEEEDADGLSLDLNERFRESAIDAWNLPAIFAHGLSAGGTTADRSAEGHIALIAYELAPQLLDGRPADIDMLIALPSAEILNLYREHLEEVVVAEEELRAELEAMP